jgi:tRNA A37 threonylcarbamoyladenosine synthetase subunit TsaC/SUA5/YrdC
VSCLHTRPVVLREGVISQAQVKEIINDV